MARHLYKITVWNKYHCSYRGKVVIKENSHSVQTRWSTALRHSSIVFQAFWNEIKFPVEINIQCLNIILWVSVKTNTKSSNENLQGKMRHVSVSPDEFTGILVRKFRMLSSEPALEATQRSDADFGTRCLCLICYTLLMESLISLLPSERTEFLASP